MTKILPIIATATLGLSLAACGSNADESADETVGTEYDAAAPSLEDVASDAEMEALEAQEEAIEEEVANDANAIDESDVTGDNAETEEIVGL